MHHDVALEPEPCDPPLNLTGDIAFPSVYDVFLDWQSPSGGGGIDEWIHYDDGINYNSIGLTQGGTFYVAIRFTPDDLTPFQGAMLTEVKFFIGSSTTTSSIELMVWEGANASSLVIDQPLSSVIVGDWNVVALDTPVPIDVTQELWIGYGCINTPLGDYPAGCDVGPAVAGFGDMISLDGVSWAPLSSYGLDYNWNLQGHVQALDGQVAELPSLPQAPIMNPAGTTLALGTVNTSPNAVDHTRGDRSLMGYNVYRDDVQINANLVVPTQYMDVGLDIGVYTYYVTAVYTLCESEPSNSVVVAVTGIEEPANELIRVYPVPADQYVTVEIGNNIRQIRMINYIGQIVYEQNVGKDRIFQINTSTFNSGTYTLEFTSDKGNVVTRRLVIAR